MQSPDFGVTRAGIELKMLVRNTKRQDNKMDYAPQTVILIGYLYTFLPNGCAQNSINPFTQSKDSACVRQATGGSASRQTPPPLEESASEPIRYVSKEQTDKRFYDGALRHAVGVHSYQAMRANRTCPPEGGPIGWTYNHQPYVAYWRDRFYLQYLSNLKEEHVPPGRTLLMSSDDGLHWSNPQVIFPEYALPEIKTDDGYLPAGTPAVMHQRMGFYVAPNRRLLTLAFYSYCISHNPHHRPNSGQGLGRVVREIRPDNTLGPIYFIRYNR
jgi:hypothetical protein